MGWEREEEAKEGKSTGIDAWSRNFFLRLFVVVRTAKT